MICEQAYRVRRVVGTAPRVQLARTLERLRDMERLMSESFDRRAAASAAREPIPEAASYHVVTGRVRAMVDCAIEEIERS